MSLYDKLMMGINTTVISMGIVFLVLIFLSIIIVIQYKILKTAGITTQLKEAVPAKKTDVKQMDKNGASEAKTGITSGEMAVYDVEEEELVAVVMAAISDASQILSGSLIIKSIKRVDDNWERVSRQELINQRL